MIFFFTCHYHTHVLYSQQRASFLSNGAICNNIPQSENLALKYILFAYTKTCTVFLKVHFEVVYQIFSIILRQIFAILCLKVRRAIKQ